ncbi:MAG: inorganic phosphate transporter [Candidatus Hadarchaeum sp.]|uniref:inorganic phosphate transporter n=1 Tax=Candidatus Hadarchaeum sp. TaxID=2883567 RepID=UPI0031763516
MIELVVYGVGLALSFYIAWCLGANDAANPTDCAVGAGALSMRKAIILFAIFAALGGILLGPMVMKTVDRGLVDRESLSVEVLALGSFSACLSAGLWITFCTYKGMPVSTTHSIIGGVIGFGLATSTPLRLGNLYVVIASLIASPILAILFAAGLYFFLKRYFQQERTEKTNLVTISILVFILSFSALLMIFYQTLGLRSFDVILMTFPVAAVLSPVLVYVLRAKCGGFGASNFLYALLIIGLCFSAFSFGANDMANATGVFVTPTQKITGNPTFTTMFLLSLLGSAGIALGAFTWGYKVLEVTAYKVTRLDILSGAAAEYANAIVVFLFTVLPSLLIGFGLPISTTHASVGSLIGVGLATKGLMGVSKGVTGKIIAFWILTIPAVILISMSLFWLISKMAGI